jgi:hypothetical protein
MMKWLSIFLIQTLFPAYIFAAEIHVSPSGSDKNPGSEAAPLKTIQYASNQAQPGDSIIVHAGIYRERINPPRGGNSDIERITYLAATGEKVIIKGSEVIDNWQKAEGSVWKVVIPNTFFANYNPFLTLLEGDWLNKKGLDHHTGEVFLNGKSLFEKGSLEEVKNPEPYPDARQPHDALYAWYSEVDDDNTTIWANFQKYDPNRELVEITVRPACFYPDQPGRNYLTINGFEMSQAATQWAAPTAEQPGLIGTHWSKGWIIENNKISNSKSAGISLGKERSTGHNVWMHNPEKDGATHYNEVIFKALEIGWSQEHIGSHIVRNNEIFHCGQAGIVGSLGAVFSQIYDNHIHDIWVKRIFDGAEMAGIKIHAAIDMMIKNNHIHNTGRGIWLDWMAQGARVTGNLLYDNTTDDLFVEVNHGPFLIDNNIFLSDLAIRDWSEGGAYAHNLIAGKIEQRQVTDRFTPYHLPHSTRVKGLRNILGGDNRFYNNIFIKTSPASTDEETIQNHPARHGLIVYDENVRYKNMAAGNVYYNGAKPGRKEENYILQDDFLPEILVEDNDEGTSITISLDNAVHEVSSVLVTTGLLGKTIVSEAIFDKPDGSHYKLDEDFFGERRDPEKPGVGPFYQIKEGLNKYKILPLPPGHGG